MLVGIGSTTREPIDALVKLSEWDCNAIAPPINRVEFVFILYWMILIETPTGGLAFVLTDRQCCVLRRNPT